MQQTVNKLLLKKFLYGECNAEELVRVRELLQDPEMKETLDQIIAEDASSDWKLWRELPVDNDEQMQGWQARFRKLRYPTQDIAIKSISKKSAVLFKYAAIWLMVIAGAAYFGLNFFKKDRQNVPATYITVKSARGHMMMFKLPDSTTVHLNAGTNIRFAKRFIGKTREVYLDGEAFFEVTHDNNKPFIIHTDKLKVQVLGTSFNVKAYKNDKDLSVTVATGKVGVLSAAKGKGETNMLLPGDELVMNRANGKLATLKVNPIDISAWQSGTMIFNNETLESITHRLERWYNVTFEVKNKALLAGKYKLKQKNESLNTVMNALSTSGEFHYKVKGLKVIIW